MSIIRAQQLSYSYPMADGELPILKKLDLEIAAGEFVAIQGPSGSGKSTLLHILGCMQQADSGELNIDGQDVAQLSKHELAYLRNQKMGFVFQNFQLLNKLTVLDNILLPTQYPIESCHTTTADREKALELARYLGLDDRLHHYPNELSGGQQQRVAIARALIRGSRILLADEPTGNLDSQSTQHILQLFKKLNEEQGITIVMITHDADVAACADKVYHFNDGCIESEVVINNRARPMQTAAASKPARSQRTSPLWPFKLLPIALKNMLRNKVRSTLTMLGIVIGIAAVLAMSTLGNFTKEKILDSYSSLGVNTLLVYGYGNWRLAATDEFPVKFKSFDIEHDLAPLLRIFPEIQKLSPKMGELDVEVSFGGRTVDKGPEVIAVSDEYLPIIQRQLFSGHNFSQYHIENQHDVCLLGFNVAEQLFVNTDPVGKIVHVKQGDNHFSCRVTGVLEFVRTNQKRGDPNAVVILPYTTFLNVMTMDWFRDIRQFVVELVPRSDIERVGNAIKNYFVSKYGMSGIFDIGADAVLLQQMQNFLNLFTLLLIIMSLIALTVGGIGISNMMLVSVSERIKEIGLYKALGATDRSMRMQFLLEAIILCCLAGLIGLAIGFICYQSVIYGAAQFFENVDYEWVINLGAMGLSAASMLIVGVVSGLLPAIKAESLQIIEALRQD